LLSSIKRITKLKPENIKCRHRECWNLSACKILDWNTSYIVLSKNNKVLQNDEI
jgi:hypothetical protein